MMRIRRTGIVKLLWGGVVAALLGLPGAALGYEGGKKPTIHTGKKPKLTSVPDDPSAPPHMPELDPSSAGSAAVLLIGGTLVVLGGRRARLRVDAPDPGHR